MRAMLRRLFRVCPARVHPVTATRDALVAGAQAASSAVVGKSLDLIEETTAAGRRTTKQRAAIQDLLTRMDRHND